MNSKKGILGVSLLNIVVTVAIVVLLLLFVLGSGFVKKISGIPNKVRILGEGEAGLGDMTYYMDSYSKLVNLRLLLGRGYLPSQIDWSEYYKSKYEGFVFYFDGGGSDER